MESILFSELHSKCDTDLDCADKSDESHCSYLILGNDYAKELLPVNENREPCFIYMNVSILAFPKIDTMNLKFTADFYLNLRWYDLRIQLLDLNNNTFLNGMSFEDRKSVWAPKLAFLNALGPYSTIVDETSGGVLVREGRPLQENIELPIEGTILIVLVPIC